jgi:hypothetical protein
MFKNINKWVKYLSNRTPITKDHTGSGIQYGQFLYNRKRPIFTSLLAQAMLADPHVKFGLSLIKGPVLAGSRFIVKCEREDQRQFIINQITRFWTRSARLALRYMHYGWYGTEVMYKIDGGMLTFEGLRNLNPLDGEPVILDGRLVGIQARLAGSQATYIPCPKAFWTVHARENHRWYGQSRLYGAHLPWYEFNAPEGFRDSRRLFFYKNAFDGGVIRYPQGAATDIDGRREDNRIVAERLLAAYRNGAGMSLPTSPDPSKSWDWERPQAQDISASFSEYGRDLRDEIWEALGVPPEIAKAQGTGAYAGRQIPQEAFYSLLQEVDQDLISDFEEQILTPLVEINYGDSYCPYEIECFGLLRSLEEDRGSHKEEARQPLGMGMPTSGGDQTEDPHLSSRGSQLNMSELVPNRRPSTANSRLDINPSWSFKIVREPHGRQVYSSY